MNIRIYYTQYALGIKFIVSIRDYKRFKNRLLIHRENIKNSGSMYYNIADIYIKNVILNSFKMLR